MRRGLAVVQFGISRALDSHVTKYVAAIGQVRPNLARVHAVPAVQGFEVAK